MIDCRQWLDGSKPFQVVHQFNYRGPAEGWTPVIKCRRFLSFFQRYIVRDISLTVIYRWLIEILSAILKSTRHGGQSRERL